MLDRWYEEWKPAYIEPPGSASKSLKAYDEKYYGYVSPKVGKTRLRDIKRIHLQKILNAEAGKSFCLVSELRNTQGNNRRR